MRLLGAPLRVRDAARRADAIVVLGARLRADGRPSAALEERVRAGVQLWQRGLAPMLCVTGGGPPGRVEAKVRPEKLSPDFLTPLKPLSIYPLLALKGGEC